MLYLIKAMRIKEMIDKALDFQANSPLQYNEKCVNNCMENMHIDVRV